MLIHLCLKKEAAQVGVIPTGRRRQFPAYVSLRASDFPLYFIQNSPIPGSRPKKYLHLSV